MLFSHPDKDLFVHLRNVADKSRYSLENLSLNLNTISEDNLKSVCYLVSVMHDIGKATISFQNFIKNPEIYKKHDTHSESSSIVAYYFLRNFCSKNVIPEIFSLIGVNAILCHHGNLKDLDDVFSNFTNDDFVLGSVKRQIQEILGNPLILDFLRDISNVYTIDYNKVINDINEFDLCPSLRIRRLIKNFSDEDILELFFIEKLLFSLLIDFDKKDAAGILDSGFKEQRLDNNLVDDFIGYNIFKNPDKFSKVLGSNKLKNSFRQVVIENYENLKDRKIFTITAPTGIGKTLTAFDLAVKIQDNLDFFSKIIYILPFTSIIDQNYGVFNDVLSLKYSKEMEGNESNFIIKHHYLSDEEISFNDYNSKNFLDDLLLLNSWESNVVVSTYVQLLYSFFSNKNSFLVKFHNILNSIIILDEVQFIGDKYWNAVKRFFNILSSRFNVTFVLMTATMPLIFSSKDSNELSESSFFENKLVSQKIDSEIINTPMAIIDLRDYVIERELANRYLFVFSTKKSALKFYEIIRLESVFKTYYIFYLSTNLTPYDRKEKIEEIKELSMDPNKKYVVVSTQLIEAGVDISSDVCYSDLANIDSLVQRAGRCNRYNEIKKGKFIVINSLINEVHNNRRFIDYINKDSFVLRETEKLLMNPDSFDLNNAVKLFFENIKGSKSDIILSNLIFGLRFKSLSDDFKLIEQDFFTFPLFIEFDLCGNIINQYKNIIRGDEKVFVKIGKIKKIRRQIMPYCVDITESQRKDLEVKGYLRSIGNFLYVPNEYVSLIYNSEKGIIIDDLADNVVI